MSADPRHTAAASRNAARPPIPATRVPDTNPSSGHWPVAVGGPDPATSRAAPATRRRRPTLPHPAFRRLAFRRPSPGRPSKPGGPTRSDPRRRLPPRHPRPCRRPPQGSANYRSVSRSRNSSPSRSADRKRSSNPSHRNHRDSLRVRRRSRRGPAVRYLSRRPARRHCRPRRHGCPVHRWPPRSAVPRCRPIRSGPHTYHRSRPRTRRSRPHTYRNNVVRTPSRHLPTPTRASPVPGNLAAKPAARSRSATGRRRPPGRPYRLVPEPSSTAQRSRQPAARAER